MLESSSDCELNTLGRCKDLAACMALAHTVEGALLDRAQDCCTAEEDWQCQNRMQIL